LEVPSDFPSGPYGRLSPKRLIDSLTGSGHVHPTGTAKVGLQNVPDGLQEGDLIAYSNGKDFEHCVLYLGKGMVTCHSACRWLADWRLPGFMTATFLRVK
jgi:hypothetical protein